MNSNSLEAHCANGVRPNASRVQSKGTSVMRASPPARGLWAVVAVAELAMGAEVFDRLAQNLLGADSDSLNRIANFPHRGTSCCISV